MACSAIAFSCSPVLRRVRAATTRAPRSLARAHASHEASSSSSSSSRVFYTDNTGARVSGTEAEYTAALATQKVYKASTLTGVALGTETTGSSYESVSLIDAMAFKGPGPELINGRCAMVAFLVRPIAP
jgi:hypothetical protein